MSYVLIFGGYLRGTVSHLLHLGQRGNVSIIASSLWISLFVDTQVFVTEVIDIEATQTRITVRFSADLVLALGSRYSMHQGQRAECGQQGMSKI